MKDFEQDLNSINQQLNENDTQRERRAHLREQVRQRLESVAKEAVGKYQEDFQKLLPLANEKVEKIIQPWCDQLVSSGTYDRLYSWVKRSKSDYYMNLTNNILYVWPRRAINGFGEISGDARFIVSDCRRGDIEEGIKTFERRNDEVWSARFEICITDHIKPIDGLAISQWPHLGGGMAFAMLTSKRLRIPLEIESLEPSVNKISPEVWIGFADQIESGKVWEVIESYLKPRKRRYLEQPTEEISRAEERAEALRMRDEFLIQRKIRYEL